MIFPVRRTHLLRRFICCWHSTLLGILHIPSLFPYTVQVSERRSNNKLGTIAFELEQHARVAPARAPADPPSSLFPFFHWHLLFRVDCGNKLKWETHCGAHAHGRRLPFRLRPWRRLRRRAAVPFIRLALLGI